MLRKCVHFQRLSNQIKKMNLSDNDKKILIFSIFGIVASIVLSKLFNAIENLFKSEKRENTEDTDRESSSVSNDPSDYGISSEKRLKEIIKEERPNAISFVKLIENATSTVGGLGTDEDMIYEAFVRYVKDQFFYDLAKQVYFERNKSNKIEGKTLEDQLRFEMTKTELQPIVDYLQYRGIVNSIL